MLDGKVVFPTIRERLVERAVLLLDDVTRAASPDWLCLVQFLVRHLLVLDLLRVFLLLAFLFIFLDLLNLRHFLVCPLLPIAGVRVGGVDVMPKSGDGLGSLEAEVVW